MKDETIKKVSKEDICMMYLQDAMRHARENKFFDIRVVAKKLLDALEKKKTTRKKSAKISKKKTRKSKKSKKRTEKA